MVPMVLLAWVDSSAPVHSQQQVSLYNFLCGISNFSPSFSVPAGYFQSCHKCQQGFLYVSCLIFLPAVSYLILLLSYDKNIGIEIVTELYNIKEILFLF